MARRRRKQNDDPVMEFVAVVAVFLSFGMYFLTKSLAFAIIVFLLMTGSIIGIQFYLLYKREERLRRSGIHDIDKMDGRQFELYLGLLYKALGYKTEVTRSTGDFGADLVIEKDGLRTVIQAKCYSKNVGIDAVQQVYAAKALYGATQAMVVTNRGFTDAAKNLARSNGVILIDREKLIEMMLKMSPNQKPDVKKVASESEKTQRQCPRCGSFLVLRSGPKGEFYGCSTFPKCRYTMNL